MTDTAHAPAFQSKFAPNADLHHRCEPCRPAVTLTEGELTGARWQYGREGEPPAAADLRFLANGLIGGYDHRSARLWRIEQGVLSLYGGDGRRSVRFDRPDMDGPRLVLRGQDLLDPAAAPLRLEQSAPPEEGVVKTLHAPGFRIPYPDLRNRDLVPPPVLQAMEGSWARGQFPAGTVEFRRLNDVFVAKEGLVFTAGLELIPTSRTQHSQAEIAWAREAIIAARSGGGMPGLQGAIHVLCKKRGVSHYGHWLLEMFPKAVLAWQHFDPAGLRFIVPEMPGRPGATIAASLQRIGLRASAIVPLGDAPVHVERLLMVDGLSAHGAYLSPLAVAAVEPLGWDIPPGPDRLLFVTRDGMGARRFRTEAAVAARARAAGYRLFDPGGATLIEQVAAFAGARRIVGMMGAGLTNIVFARRGAQVTVLAPADLPDTFFWFIAGLRGLGYREIRCALAERHDGTADWDRELEFPEQYVAEIFAATA